MIKKSLKLFHEKKANKDNRDKDELIVSIIERRAYDAPENLFQFL